MSEVLTLIAIGNDSMGDDGIALALVECIKEKIPADINVQLWESKDALSVASELLGIDTPIIIVDCADMGLSGGTFRWFRQSECQLELHQNVISTHGFGFSDALALAEQLGFSQAIYFFAIQAENIELECGISQVLKNNLPHMSDSLLSHIDDLRVTK
ncbi:MAG: hydrogenase maturation protease [Gammaproteobacteria bacterium]|nr:hydrogenase maturation protease [Gammaproteobacteria bacterium]